MVPIPNYVEIPEIKLWFLGGGLILGGRDCLQTEVSLTFQVFTFPIQTNHQHAIIYQLSPIIYIYIHIYIYVYMYVSPDDMLMVKTC